MIKLIACDMDGTLLNSRHEIDEENIEAIRNAEKSGIVFAISTGREYDNVENPCEYKGFCLHKFNFHPLSF